MARTILIAVIGLSPQVITEALYALYKEGKHVDAIHLLTTRTGKDAVLKGLLSATDNKLHRFRKDFHIRQGIDCGPHTLHVLHDDAGIEVDDITTIEDNEIFLRMCLELAFRFTADPETVVYFLVAGGRKTMTSCLTLAAQLYGRPCDRIYHVLVASEFESCRDFWYPPPQSRPLRLVDKQGREFIMETRHARIQLIAIPFISVRDQLGADLLDQPRPPADLLASLVREESPRLVVKLNQTIIQYSGREMDCNPSWLALYAFFVQRRKQARCGGGCKGCPQCFADINTITDNPEIAEWYQKIRGRRTDAMSDTGITRLSTENFRSYRSRINRALISHFGSSSAARIVLGTVGRRPDTLYGIPLSSEHIEIRW